jgi:hypothetical protein
VRFQPHLGWRPKWCVWIGCPLAPTSHMLWY